MTGSCFLAQVLQFLMSEAVQARQGSLKLMLHCSEELQCVLLMVLRHCEPLQPSRCLLSWGGFVAATVLLAHKLIIDANEDLMRICWLLMNTLA